MAEGAQDKEEFVLEKEEVKTIKGRRKRTKCVTVCLVTLIIFLIVVAFIGGYLVRRAIAGTCKASRGTVNTAETEKLYSEAIDGVSPTNLEKQLKVLLSCQKTERVTLLAGKVLDRYFSSIPHIAGSNESHQQAIYFRDRLKEFGFDSAELKRYDILLSYPNKPGIVSLLEDDGTVLSSSVPYEKILDPAENDSRVVSPFNAYSPSGNVKGKLIYANYGHEDDFKYLEKEGVNITDKIVIVRYGKLFRGGKSQNAERRGAKGLIIYSDPHDYASEGVNKTYPDYRWLSSDSVQRGNLMMVKGDPLTPGYPATEGIYRVSKESRPFPKIPVQPISWSDATPLLKTLTARRAPTEWQGGLGFPYNIEMAFSDTREVRVEVSNRMEQMPVYNVIGTIQGSEEPDRYVIIGCHRDAWVFGAVDPSSGVSVLLETARMLGNLVNKGWRPRRTILIASWGAEEHGIMGSAEWVEEFDKILNSRAVAYINVDSAVMGSYSFAAKGSPIMDMALFQATKEVPSPDDKTKTLYESWKEKRPDKKKENPSIAAIGAGSDFLFFLQRVGVPCVDLLFASKKSGYPVYHTLHDTFQWIKKFTDPDFRYHSAVTKVTLRLSFNIADTQVIPFDLNRLASSLEGYGKVLEDQNSKTLAEKGISLKYVTKAIDEFKTSAKAFMEFLASLNKETYTASRRTLQLRMANDRLIQVERSFINSEGLPGRPAIRHLVFAPSVFNLYAGSKFAGITDSIHEAKKSNDTKDWEQVKKQISMVVHAVRSAVTVIKPSKV